MYNQLKSKWTFWVDKPDLAITNTNWDQFLIKVVSFQNIEEFWSLFKSIMLPSQLQIGVNFHFFKLGIEPRWEDPHNLNGGKWMLTIPRQTNISIDRLWEKSLSMLIGEYTNSVIMDNINGIVLNIRKYLIKISIWTKDSFNKKIQLSIGKNWKRQIKKNFVEKNIEIEYFSHLNFINKLI